MKTGVCTDATPQMTMDGDAMKWKNRAVGDGAGAP